ncbi:hypothetical protein LTS00_007180 [Friedmanniomyces endolithicus]|nr:hypothetical protein LTS00_007180 [Friedmanniomyces endolithicus]
MCAFAYVLQRSKVRTASLNHVQYGIFDAGLQCSTTLLSLLLHPENLDPKYSCETHLPRNPDPQPLKNGYPSGRKAPPIMEPSNTAIRTVHLETFKTTSTKQIIRNIARIFTTFPYRDTAFWSAWSYTIGSALFIIVSAFAWAPLAYPRAAFAGEQKYGVPLSFFLGALFFQLGAVVAYLEAVNTVPSHGIAMGNMLDGRETGGHEAREEALHGLFQHLVPDGSVVKVREGTAGLSIAVLKLQRAPGSGGVDAGEAGEGSSNGHRTWRWWPTWHTLRTYHTYEIGYLACSFQLLGATLYCAVAVVIMPGILDSLDT